VLFFMPFMLFMVINALVKEKGNPIL